jgi:hypothetical protein
VAGVRERGEGKIMARLPWVSPLPCVHRLEDKENKRERERGGRLGLPLDRFCKERKNKRREEEEMKGLAEICLKFEIFKFWPKCWW